MNGKEIKEIRKRLKYEHNNVTNFFGCYVNSEGNIIAHLDEAVGLLATEEAMKYFDIFKKTLSGKPGKTLLYMEFSCAQEGGDAYQTLLSLWKNHLANQEDRDRLCREIIDNLSLEGNYVILMMLDQYDVPSKKDDDPDNFDSDETFTYFICSVCPVKHGKVELGYRDSEQRFLDASARQLIDKPILGFMFPSFNDRSTDIHHAAVFAKKTDENYEPFVTAVFGSSSEIPLTGDEQKAKFETILVESLENGCNFEVVHTMHEALAEQIAVHKESGSPDPLTISPQELGTILRNAGADHGAVAEFESSASALVKETAESPGIQVDNITDMAKMVIETEGVKIIAKSEKIHAVETTTINGRPVIVIDIQDYCTINGMNVQY